MYTVMHQEHCRCCGIRHLNTYGPFSNEDEACDWAKAKITKMIGEIKWHPGVTSRISQYEMLTPDTNTPDHDGYIYPILCDDGHRVLSVLEPYPLTEV